MNYAGMPQGMWILFSGSFRKNLSGMLAYDRKEASKTAAAAKKEYRKIISSLPAFERQDRFKMITVNCALYCAYLLALAKRPDKDEAAAYYRRAMMTRPMKWYCRITERRRFTKCDLEKKRKAAGLKAADRNRYSYNVSFLPYEDGTGYEIRYTHCGICTLMRELGLYEYVPGMCLLEYDMSKAGGITEFKRAYTFPTGGPYCDCGYLKKKR